MYAISSIEEIVGAMQVEHKDYEKEHKFINLPPSKYMVRLTYDTNKNGKWDTGNFLRRLKPEVIYYFENIITAKANWQVEESFIME